MQYISNIVNKIILSTFEINSTIEKKSVYLNRLHAVSYVYFSGARLFDLPVLYYTTDGI